MARRTINPALTRPETVAGAEKMPLGVVVVGAVLFGMIGWWFASILAGVVSAILLFVGVPLVRTLGRADPMMIAVYRANLGLRDFYPARSPAHVPEAKPRQNQAVNLGSLGLVLIAAAWALSFATLYWIGAAFLALAVIAPLFAAKRTPPSEG